MTKKSILIIAGSTVLAGSVITGIAVPLSQKANQSTPEQKQEQQQDDSKKTGENSEQVETNKQQDDSQKDNQSTPEQKQEQEKIPALTEEKQQNGAEAGSGEKTEENSAQAESTKPQVDSQKDSDTQKQQDEVEAGSGEKAEENSTQVESTKPQVDSQKDSTKEEQQNGVESASGEDNKAAQPMESQVDSQNNGTEKQQNNGEVGEKVENSSDVESSEQKGTELQSQLTPVNLLFRDGYFFLRLRTSKTTFDKIKKDRLEFTLDKGNREYDELASEITQSNHTAYYLNYLDQGNDNVSFEITSEQRYGSDPNEKGTYKVTKV